MRRNNFAVGVVTIYVLIYCLLLQFEGFFHYAMLMVLTSPVLIGWMVFTILKQGKYSGPEMGNDEFGYQDKKKDDLQIF
ncbi:MAG TPA: hypothetical protein VMT76_10365 [Puia sp.]|nr:hypothetical protein [Puia sp.]